MARREMFCTVIAAALATVTFGQTHGQVDFARDIQPILKTRCVGCHGPEQQMNGYRLDRRSAALGGVIRSNVIPGSSESSRLYRRVTSSQFGLQMPPTGPLPQAEVDLLKRWIDEGAHWPAELANEANLAPPDPDATKLIDTIRRGDAAVALQQIEASPAVLGKTGPGGSTPLMEASLAGDASLVAAMLKRGADPNGRNHARATALMWSLDRVEIARMLLDAGADPNAASDFGRTPLAIAAGQNQSQEMIKLLLERGAKPVPAALITAAFRGNAEAVRLMLSKGAKDNGVATAVAIRSGCKPCLDALDAGAQLGLST